MQNNIPIYCKRWESSDNNSSGKFGIWESDKKRIATVDGDSAESEENAQLLAASPEMLNMLILFFLSVVHRRDSGIAIQNLWKMPNPL